MKKKLFSYLSTGTLIVGALLGGYALVDSFIVRSKLPAGACPLTDNRPIIYTAIALLLISFVLSIIEQRFKKEIKPSEKPETDDNEQNKMQ